MTPDSCVFPIMPLDTPHFCEAVLHPPAPPPHPALYPRIFVLAVAASPRALVPFGHGIDAAKRLVEEQPKDSRGSPKETAGLGRSCPAGPVSRGPWKLQPSGPIPAPGRHSGVFPAVPLQAGCRGWGCSEPPWQAAPGQGQGARTGPRLCHWTSAGSSEPQPQAQCSVALPCLCTRWGSCAFVGTRGSGRVGAQDQRGQWWVAPRGCGEPG